MKISKLITSALVIVTLYFFVAKPAIVDKILLQNNFKYTVGKAFAKESTAEGGMWFVYAYNVDNKEYKNGFSETTTYQTKVGDCYLVAYYPPNPKIAEINLDSLKICR